MDSDNETDTERNNLNSYIYEIEFIIQNFSSVKFPVLTGSISQGLVVL